MAFQVVLAPNPGIEIPEASLSLEFVHREQRFRTTRPSRIGEARIPFSRMTAPETFVFDFEAVRFRTMAHATPASQLPQGVPIDQHPLRLTLNARLDTFAGTAAFGFRNLLSNDILHVFAVSAQMFLANVLHGPRGTVPRTLATRCIARCANGKSAHGCVTCVHRNITVKVCC